jgi:hypothetical protein
MNRLAKITITIAMLTGLAGVAFADRGTGKKGKSKVVLNVTNPSALKNNLAFNLKSGLSYKGSLLSSRQSVGSTIANTTITTYQKGNTTYIIPYKYKVAVADMKQGYTGIKIIIRPH